MNILNEIDDWKLDAKQEVSEKYFYHPKELETIESGKHSFIIGRKGCGKTAISESIYGKSGYNIYSEKLTFKSFPFNNLYKLSDDSYTQPNQYITLWKYLIYSSVCRMFVRNEGIDSELTELLEKKYGGTSAITNLRRDINKWVAKEWSLKLLGAGGKLVLSDDENNQSWIEKVDILEDVIIQYIDKSDYYIVFDELDEDYSSIVKSGGQSNYLALITSLFKAVQDIKSVFSNSDIGVKPIIFLRDDIYDLITDSDKNKWNDFRLDLDWNRDTIKELLAFRITKASSNNGNLLSFESSWKLIFEDQPIRYGNKQQKKIDIFSYMTKSTQLRPRDYIKYIQACAHDALKNKNQKISANTVKRVDKLFSNYLKEELVDEIHGVLPDIKEILSVISEIRKWSFSIDEFRDQYQIGVNNGSLQMKNPDLALKILFHFSVIGNQPKQKQITFFRYNNKEARMNFNEKIVVHRGLFKALQIL